MSTTKTSLAEAYRTANETETALAEARAKLDALKAEPPEVLAAREAVREAETRATAARDAREKQQRGVDLAALTKRDAALAWSQFRGPIETLEKERRTREAEWKKVDAELRAKQESIVETARTEHTSASDEAKRLSVTLSSRALPEKYASVIRGAAQHGPMQPIDDVLSTVRREQYAHVRTLASLAGENLARVPESEGMRASGTPAPSEVREALLDGRWPEIVDRFSTVERERAAARERNLEATKRASRIQALERMDDPAEARVRAREWGIAWPLPKPGQITKPITHHVRA